MRSGQVPVGPVLTCISVPALLGPHGMMPTRQGAWASARAWPWEALSIVHVHIVYDFFFFFTIKTCSYWLELDRASKPCWFSGKNGSTASRGSPTEAHDPALLPQRFRSHGHPPGSSLQVSWGGRVWSPLRGARGSWPVAGDHLFSHQPCGQGTLVLWHKPAGRSLHSGEPSPAHCPIPEACPRGGQSSCLAETRKALELASCRNWCHLSRLCS